MGSGLPARLQTICPLLQIFNHVWRSSPRPCLYWPIALTQADNSSAAKHTPFGVLSSTGFNPSTVASVVWVCSWMGLGSGGSFFCPLLIQFVMAVMCSFSNREKLLLHRLHDLGEYRRLALAAPACYDGRPDERVFLPVWPYFNLCFSPIADPRIGRRNIPAKSGGVPIVRAIDLMNSWIFGGKTSTGKGLTSFSTGLRVNESTVRAESPPSFDSLTR